MDDHILRLIFERTEWIDLIRCGAVSTQWKRLVLEEKESRDCVKYDIDYLFWLYNVRAPLDALKAYVRTYRKGDDKEALSYMLCHSSHHYDDMEFAMILLDKGVDPEYRSQVMYSFRYYDECPFFIALQYEQTHLIEYMMEKGLRLEDYDPELLYQVGEWHDYAIEWLERTLIKRGIKFGPERKDSE